MEKIRVILADDHALVREGTSSLLNNEPDMEVIAEADNGLDAVTLAERLHPDIVLLDIAMPKLNGIEATRRIKECYPAAAVLILSAYDNDQYIIAILEAGAAGYLLKNVKGSDLVNAIRSVHGGEAVLHPTIAAKVFKRFANSERHAPAPEETRLSKRELEILKLASRGCRNPDIADSLYLSRRTVQTHLTHIFAKMGVGSRTEAVLLALQKGWLTLDDTAADAGCEDQGEKDA